MTPPLDAATLAELRELHEKAAPGPWIAASFSEGIPFFEEPKNAYVFDADQWESAEAALIVRMRDALPALLAAAEAEQGMRVALAGLTEACDRFALSEDPDQIDGGLVDAARRALAGTADSPSLAAADNVRLREAIENHLAVYDSTNEYPGKHRSGAWLEDRRFEALRAALAKGADRV